MRSRNRTRKRVNKRRRTNNRTRKIVNKRRRRTNNRTRKRVNKRRRTRKSNRNFFIDEQDGGMLGESKRCALPPPKPYVIPGLKVITKFEQLEPYTLYVFSSDADILYAYFADRFKFNVEKEVRELEHVIQEYEEVVEDDPDYECELDVYSKIISGFEEGISTDKFDVLVYRLPLPSRHNHTCTMMCGSEAFPEQWKPPIGSGGQLRVYDTRLGMSQPVFDYYNEIYNIYETDKFPQFLPIPPPLEKKLKEESEIYVPQPGEVECQGEYIKDHIYDEECNIKCCGWPNAEFPYCNEIDGHGVCSKDDPVQKVYNEWMENREKKGRSSI